MLSTLNLGSSGLGSSPLLVPFFTQVHRCEIALVASYPETEGGVGGGEHELGHSCEIAKCQRHLASEGRSQQRRFGSD